jgi:hypothetical protein
LSYGSQIPLYPPENFEFPPGNIHEAWQLSRYSDWATAWTIGVLGFYSRRGLGIFPVTIVFRMTVGPTHPPIQWVPGALSLGVKRLGHEADHSPPSSAKVKEYLELYLHFPNTPSWRGA